MYNLSVLDGPTFLTVADRFRTFYDPFGVFLVLKRSQTVEIAHGMFILNDQKWGILVTHYDLERIVENVHVHAQKPIM